MSKLKKIQMVTIAAGPNGGFSPGQKLKVGKEISEEQAQAFVNARAAVDITKPETAEAPEGETGEGGNKGKPKNMSKEDFESAVADFSQEHGEEVLGNLLDDVKPKKVKAADRQTVADVLAAYKAG